jgi:hypothetical protein
LPTSSPKTQPKFQSPIIIVGQYLIHIQNPLVLNYGVRSINYLKRRLFPSRCLGCGQGICPCHQATAIAALALLTSSIQIAFPLRHLHHRHPVNRLPRSTSASAFGATTPPSTAHPTPCLFLYDAAEEGFQGLRHGEVPRRLELARGQHGGWGGSSISCTHLVLQARTVVAPRATPAMRCLRMWSSGAAAWGRSVHGWTSASAGGAACTRSTLPSFLFVPRSEIDCNFTGDLFDFSSAERCYFHIGLCRASCSDRFAPFFLTLFVLESICLWGLGSCLLNLDVTPWVESISLSSVFPVSLRLGRCTSTNQRSSQSQNSQII